MSDKKEYSMKEMIMYIILLSIVSGGAGTIVGSQNSVSEDRVVALEERMLRTEVAQEKLNDTQVEMLVLLGEIRSDIRHLSRAGERND